MSFSSRRIADMSLDVLQDPDRLRGTLSPLRRRLLEELREPDSATGLAARLGESRQRLNYHLRELERGGLVELVEQRQRRGRTERILRATGHAGIVAPAGAGGRGPPGRGRVRGDAALAAPAPTFNERARGRRGAERGGQR